jgi:hypothetical protein
LSSPKENVGKIVKSLEKFFDAQAGRIRVKSRPALIIGFESNYSSAFDVDYELLPISSLTNQTPDPTYDYLIDSQACGKFGLAQASYIRTHKTAWNHIKHMVINPPICDLKTVDPELFNKLLSLNEQWVINRTVTNKLNLTQESVGK